MGWFSKEKQDNQYHPVDRSSRKQCWDARDAFFSCLDGIDVINAQDPSQQKQIKQSCRKQESQFHDSCAESWIKYFKEKRVVDYKKDKFLKEMEQQNATRIDLSPEQVAGRGAANGAAKGG